MSDWEEGVSRPRPGGHPGPYPGVCVSRLTPRGVYMSGVYPNMH